MAKGSAPKKKAIDVKHVVAALDKIEALARQARQALEQLRAAQDPGSSLARRPISRARPSSAGC